jgi:cytidine deaminase
MNESKSLPDDVSTHAHQDFQDIALAHRYRLSLTTLPTQSSFRVIAIVFYQVGSVVASNAILPSSIPQNFDDCNDNLPYVVGTNDEPGAFIGGSICAERAALVQLRFLPNVKVSKIVIVTDHEDPISPGMLCREFMAGHSAVPWDVPIVLAGSGRCGDAWTVTKTTLRYLYPHPSPYARLTASQAEELGKMFSASEMKKDTYKSSLCERDVERLMEAAREAAHRDTRMGLHPIQFGAAVLFDDNSIVSAHQKKALEYGSTLDAVSQLASDIERTSARPVALVQLDSHGMAHAPFAPARAYLSEHGYGDCRVLLHTYHHGESTDDNTNDIQVGELLDVMVSDLAPVAPDIGNLWNP